MYKFKSKFWLHLRFFFIHYILRKTFIGYLKSLLGYKSFKISLTKIQRNFNKLFIQLPLSIFTEHKSNEVYKPARSLFSLIQEKNFIRIFLTFRLQFV